MSTDYDTGYENGSLAAMEHAKAEIDALKALLFTWSLDGCQSRK